jgi:hypothetical protein
MRLTSALLTLVFTGIALFAGCGSATIDCTTTCNKAKECNSATDLAKCQSQCEQVNKVVDSSYAGALSACADLSCDQQGKCVTDAAKSCTNDPAPYIEQYCQKYSSCNAAVTVDACKTMLEAPSGMEQIAALKCINDATLSDLASCIDKATCATFDADLEACINMFVNF